MFPELAERLSHEESEEGKGGGGEDNNQSRKKATTEGCMLTSRLALDCVSGTSVCVCMHRLSACMYVHVRAKK